MSMIDPPKKWARLVAVGPASIVVGLLTVVFAVAGIPGSMELAVLLLALAILSPPAVLVGTWMDVEVVEAETGVGQKRWVWALLAVFFAPIVGALYLWTRRKYFEEAQGVGN